MVSKFKTIYVCNVCGSQFPKWMGQCSECNAWNSIVEDVIQIDSAKKNPRIRELSKDEHVATVFSLQMVSVKGQDRFTTRINELDRVLGGGLVIGSVILIGGDPGIGKSTLLLQISHEVASGKEIRRTPSSNLNTILYVTGEESLEQIALRAKRLGLAQNNENLKLLAQTEVEKILAVAEKIKPSIMIIDSIQTMMTSFLQSAPGSVSQVRESASLFVTFAKQTGTILFLVGHVTKQGSIAGPRVLEHMVDTVLYFEGEMHGRYRVVRSVKNRFGAVNELGMFAMTDKGLKEVTNPSAIFLSSGEQDAPGRVVMATWEGSRPILVEIQALADKTYLANPRRVAIGVEINRLSMLLAVLHRHVHIPTYDQDVFVNVVGGIRVEETASDLPLLLAIVSSLNNQPLSQDLMVFGEIGLSGEIRPVQNGQERLKEAVKHGFKRAIIPEANVPKQEIKGINIMGIKHLKEAIALIK